MVSLTAKKNLQKTIELEKIMQDARKLADDVQLPRDSSVKILGQLDVRLVCHACKLGKHFEGREFATTSDIVQVHLLQQVAWLYSCQVACQPYNMQCTLMCMSMCVAYLMHSFTPVEEFVQKLSDAVGVEVTAPSSWGVRALQSAGPSSSTASTAHTQTAAAANETLDQAHSRSFQLAKAGWVIGAYVQPKEQETVGIWQIQAMSDDGATLAEMKSGHIGQTKEVEMSALQNAWRLHKGKVTQLLEGWSFESNICSPLLNESWQIEVWKGYVNIAMWQVYKKHEGGVKHLELLQHPTSVKTTVAVVAHQLRLPAASNRIVRQSTKDSVLVSTFDIGELYILPTLGKPLDKDGKDNNNAWVCPFWMVGLVKEEAAANMDLVYEKVVVHKVDVRIPILTNTKPLAAGEELTWVRKGRSRSPGAGAHKRARKA